MTAASTIEQNSDGLIWIIREHTGNLSRPVTSAHLLARLNQRELDLEDELCLANSISFYVREKELLQKHLNPSSEILQKYFKDEEKTLDKTRLLSPNTQPQSTENPVSKLESNQVLKLLFWFGTFVLGFVLAWVFQLLRSSSE